MLLWAAGGACWPRCDVAPELAGDIGWGIRDTDACGFLPEYFLTEPFIIARNAGYHMAISGRTETNISLCRKLNLKGLHDNQGATEAAKNHISSGCQLPVFLALGRMILPWYSHPPTAQPQGLTEPFCVCSSSSSCPACCGLHKVWQVRRYSQLRTTELAGTEAEDWIPTVPRGWNHPLRSKNKCKQNKVTEEKKIKISLALALPEFSFLQTNYPVTAWEIPENVNRKFPPWWSDFPRDKCRKSHVLRVTESL